MSTPPRPVPVDTHITPSPLSPVGPPGVHGFPRKGRGPLDQVTTSVLDQPGHQSSRPGLPADSVSVPANSKREEVQGRSFPPRWWSALRRLRSHPDRPPAPTVSESGSELRSTSPYLDPHRPATLPSGSCHPESWTDCTRSPLPPPTCVYLSPQSSGARSVGE